MDREENLRKWELSRRKFLKVLAGGVAAGVAGTLLPAALVDRDNAEQSSEDGEGNEQDASTRRLRQWMMIIDLRRCDGCQSQGTPPQCTEACNTGHFVPEPMEWIEVYEHELSADIGEIEELDAARRPAVDGTRFMPTPCQQCQNPPCVNVCPVGATWSTPEGPVLIDQSRCIGCRMCMAACPYERRFFTWGKPPTPPSAIFVEPSVEHQIPMQEGVVYKCDFCPEMARAGRLPFCAQACPQNAIYYGDLEEDLATNGEDVVRVSKFLSENSPFRYKEELGTRPRVYYIPGHGEMAGRNPRDRGRAPVRWATDVQEGAKTWQRGS